jgi:hypothetical protein
VSPWPSPCGFVKHTVQSQTDKLMRLLGNVTMGAASWETYYYLGNTSGSLLWRVKIGDSNLVSQDNSPLFNRQRAFMTTVKTAKPNRVVPRPWTP